MVPGAVEQSQSAYSATLTSRRKVPARASLGRDDPTMDPRFARGRQLRRNFVISSAEYPSSRSTSSVCWPCNGGSPAATGSSPVQRKPSIEDLRGLARLQRMLAQLRGDAARSCIRSVEIRRHGMNLRRRHTGCCGAPPHGRRLRGKRRHQLVAQQSLPNARRKLSRLGGVVGISVLSAVISGRPSTHTSFELAKRVGGGRDPAVGGRKRIGTRAADESAVTDTRWRNACKPVVRDHAAHQQGGCIDHRHVEHDLRRIAACGATVRRGSPVPPTCRCRYRSPESRP